MDDKIASRIRVDPAHLSVADESKWPEVQDEMISTMIRFEHSLRPEIDKLDVCGSKSM